MVDLTLDVFQKDEPDVEESFRSIVGHWMWLVNQTRPYILIEVRAVARYSAAPTFLQWKAALHILMYIKSMSEHVRYYFTEGSEKWSSAGVVRGCGLRQRGH